jgi:DNA-binding SARP family transcriptional activator
LNTLAEAKLALRLDHDAEAARAAIERPESRRSALGFRFIDEMRDTWLGLTLLQIGQDAAALTRLRRAVEGMVAGDRILELPTAAVCLAEALWRAGDEQGADRAADLALDAARRQGSNHLLLQALADFPAVVSRRIDAEAGADSPWHELGRALIAQGAAVDTVVASAVRLREFGTRSLLVNGDEVKPRIAKIYELLSYLVARDASAVDRQELLNALFDGRADVSSRSYLSQALNGLRQVLPPDTLIIDGSRVRLVGEVAATSDSTRFESLLAQAARLQGGERLAATLQGLALYDGGEYLPGRRSTWADTRAGELAGLATGARYEAAELAFTAGRYDLARGLAEQVLAADPYHEPAWRLAMRIAEAQGDQQGVVRAYRDCEEALERLDASPSPATRELLARLRR